MNRSMQAKHGKAKKCAIAEMMEDQNIFAGTSFCKNSRQSRFSADFWLRGITKENKQSS